jgi:RimJ/RimL family protein N-acetyltransferase
MFLLPIDIDRTKNTRFLCHTEGAAVTEVYPEFYKRVGYQPPWIGYFASPDGIKIVGAAGFKGQPKGGKVEIAYGTFENHRCKGIATEICRQLVLLSLQTDPTIKITARTLLDNPASMRVLEKNGFECLGTVYDEEDGNVLEWEFKKQST